MGLAQRVQSQGAWEQQPWPGSHSHPVLSNATGAASRRTQSVKTGELSSSEREGLDEEEPVQRRADRWDTEFHAAGLNQRGEGVRRKRETKKRYTRNGVTAIVPTVRRR